MLAQGSGGPETNSLGNFIHGVRRGFQQALSLEQTLLDKPLMRCGSCLFPESPGKRPGRH
jgi:hypothetical protein